MAEVICAGVHVLDVLAGPLPVGVAPWTPQVVDRIRLTVACSKCEVLHVELSQRRCVMAVRQERQN